MPTSSNVTIFVDRSESPRIIHHPSRPLPGLPAVTVPESVSIGWAPGECNVHISGTPVEVAAWFRQVADQIDAMAAAALIAAQHEPLVSVAS